MDGIAKILENVAPMLATAVAGPSGGVVVSLIEKTLGIDSKLTSDSLTKAMQDSQTVIKLQELENSHSEALLSLSNQSRQQELLDTQDARKMNIMNKDWIVHLLAIIWTLGFFLYVIIQEIHPNTLDKGIFHDLLNSCAIILSFYFGSAYTIMNNKQK
jgi:hypothetical protein